MNSNSTLARASASEGIEITTCVDAFGCPVIAGSSAQTRTVQNKPSMDFADMLALSDSYSSARREAVTAAIQTPPVVSGGNNLSQAAMAMGQPQHHNAVPVTQIPDNRELMKTGSAGLLQHLHNASRLIAATTSPSERERHIADGRRIVEMLLMYNRQQRAVLENPMQYMTREAAGIRPDMSLEDMISTFNRLEQRSYSNTPMDIEEHITLYLRMYIVSHVIRETINAQQKKSPKDKHSRNENNKRDIAFTENYEDARNPRAQQDNNLHENENNRGGRHNGNDRGNRNQRNNNGDGNRDHGYSSRHHTGNDYYRTNNSGNKRHGNDNYTSNGNTWGHGYEYGGKSY